MEPNHSEIVPSPAVDWPPNGTERPTPEPMQQSLPTEQSRRLRFQELFEFAPDGYLITDLQGVIREANHTAAMLFGSRKEFLIGVPLGLLMADESSSRFYAQLTRLRASEGLAQWEATIRGRRKEPCEVMVAAAVLPDDSGQSAQVRWMLRDISLIGGPNAP